MKKVCLITMSCLMLMGCTAPRRPTTAAPAATGMPPVPTGGMGNTPNATPGQPTSGAAPNGQTVSAGTIVTSGGQVVANTQTAPVQGLTVSKDASSVRLAYSSLPAQGHVGNIDTSLTPRLFINRLTEGGVIGGKWEGNTAVFPGGNVLSGDVGNAYFDRTGSVGAVWARLEGATAGGGVTIQQDPSAPSKLQLKF